MASACQYMLRDPNQLELDQHPFLNILRLMGSSPKMFDVSLQQEAPDAEAEIMELFTDILDGTGTAVKVDIVSASADDDTGGTGLITMALIGISATSATGTFSLYAETITINGITAVTSTRFYKRIIALQGITFGTGGSAAGAITVSELGGVTKTYATLQAAMTASISARFYVPTGFSAQIIMLYANVIQATGAAAAALDTGAKVRPVLGGTGWDDELHHQYTILPANDIDLPLHWSDLPGNDTKYFTLKHVIVNTGANKNVHYDYKIAFWRTTPLPWGV